jgi:hypothetical protein
MAVMDSEGVRHRSALAELVHRRGLERASEVLIRWTHTEAGGVIRRARLRGEARGWGYLTEKKLVANVQFPLSSIAWISSSYSVSDWRKAAGMGISLALAGSSAW